MTQLQTGMSHLFHLRKEERQGLDSIDGEDSNFCGLGIFFFFLLFSCAVGSGTKKQRAVHVHAVPHRPYRKP